MSSGPINESDQAVRENTREIRQLTRQLKQTERQTRGQERRGARGGGRGGRFGFLGVLDRRAVQIIGLLGPIGRAASGALRSLISMDRALTGLTRTRDLARDFAFGAAGDPAIDRLRAGLRGATAGGVRLSDEAISRILAAVVERASTLGGRDPGQLLTQLLRSTEGLPDFAQRRALNAFFGAEFGPLAVLDEGADFTRPGAAAEGLPADPLFERATSRTAEDLILRGFGGLRNLIGVGDL